MRFDKFTLKSQEILQGAMSLADKRGNPQIEPVHLLAVLLEVSEEIARPVLGKVGANVNALLAEVTKAVEKLPQARGPRPRRTCRPRPPRYSTRPRTSPRRCTTSTCLGGAHPGGPDRLGHPGGQDPQGPGRDHRRHPQRAQGHPRLPDRDRPEPRGQVRGAQALRPRPHRAGRQGQAGPGDRARRGDPPGHPDSQPPHQEQPGA